ncbi:MAG: hypothetical protein V4760_14590 [Bdellovibrionota bacterium]
MKSRRPSVRGNSSAHENEAPISAFRFVATALAVWLSIFLTARAFAAPVISPVDLEREIAARVAKAAQKMGVKVYLFGGTAAGFAHYVKWDMQRERGDKNFQTENFDYDYTNIYRSTQDLDIVLDGTAEQATALEQLLMNKYAYMKGGKSRWEVRLLREKRGEKIALLENADFLDQHTDSNSTGLIEITKAAAGETVRDLRDWKSRVPFFLRDVAEGKIHYYDSPRHSTTSHFIKGENPQIVSVIRFLTKAFQFELEVRSEDLATIKRAIDVFDSRADLKNPRALAWIEKNAPKLIQNAVNIEYAVDTLEALGLRRKLVALGNHSHIDTMAWWLSREPLRTKSIGQKDTPGKLGKTAAELGLDIVAHETNSFLAYESITRSHRGDANVLSSRTNVTGEAAAFGEGFYTRVGRSGARGTNITIRFRLDPRARLGSDFTVFGDYVVVTNKAALKVIAESLKIEFVDFVEMITGKEFEELKSELALMEKLRRRLAKWKSRPFTSNEKARLRKLFAKNGPIENFLIRPAHVDDLAMLIEPFRGTVHEAWFKERMQTKQIPINRRLYLFHKLGWDIPKPLLLQAFEKTVSPYDFETKFLNEVVSASYARDRDFEVVKAYLLASVRWTHTTQSHYDFGAPEFLRSVKNDPLLWSKKVEMLEVMVRAHELELGTVHDDLAILREIDGALTRVEAEPLVKRLMEFWKPSEPFIRELLKSRGVALGAERLEKIVDGMASGKFAQNADTSMETTLSKLMEVGHQLKPSRSQAWLERLMQQRDLARAVVAHLKQVGPDLYPGVVEKIMRGEVPHALQDVFGRVCLPLPAFTRPRYFDIAIEADAKREPLEKRLMSFIHALKGEGWYAHPEVLDKVMALDLRNGAFMLDSDSSKWAMTNPKAMARLLREGEKAPIGHLGESAVASFLEKASSHPEWIEIIFRRELVGEKLMKGSLNLPWWKHDPVLLEVVKLAGGFDKYFGVSYEALRKAFVEKGITIEQARASLVAPKSPTLTQKWLKPRSAAPTTCPQVFISR